VLDDDRRRDAAADIESSFDADAARGHGGHQIVEDAVRDGLVERALVAIRPQVDLPRLQLDAQPIGHVLHPDRREVRLSRLGAKAGELRAVEPDEVVALRVRVGEGFQRFRRSGGHGRRPRIARRRHGARREVRRPPDPDRRRRRPIVGWT
jgi:hypothetical protein